MGSTSLGLSLTTQQKLLKFGRFFLLLMGETLVVSPIFYFGISRFGLEKFLISGGRIKDPKDSFLHGQLSDAFVLVYRKNKFSDASVKVWEIHYPPDIQTDPKYLKTGFPEIDDTLQLQ